MNPITRSLLDKVEDKALEGWVLAWDQVEALIVAIYRGGAVDRTQARSYRRLREQLVRDHSQWSASLQPHWRGAVAGGEPVVADPFLQLLETEEAVGFVGNWGALQLLPAAREALNSYLLERLGAEAG